LRLLRINYAVKQSPVERVNPSLKWLFLERDSLLEPSRFPPCCWQLKLYTYRLTVNLQKV